MANLSQMIRDAREARGLSQYALADLLKVRNTTVSGWELGKHNPSPDAMVTIIEVLELDPDEAASAYLEAWRR
jgi:transcriptional regulator with XRE-family HTH domain